MGIWTFALSNIFLANVVLRQAAVVSSQDFTYIGSLRSPNEMHQMHETHFHESQYYISAGSSAVAWTTAQQSCRNLAINATLVSVETVEEWEFLKIMLEPYGIATYWSSGMYDLGARMWRWSSNNLPIRPDAPWDNGHPPNSPNGLLRVLISYVSRNVAAWRTVQNTQSHRYICELNIPPPEPITCVNNDLVIVLDSSASIGSYNYRNAKLFASNVFRNVTTLGDDSRIGFLVYSDEPTVIFDLNNTLTTDEIINAKLNAPYLRGDTATHLAIDSALLQFNTFPRNLPRNLVVITDGESTNSTLTAASIEQAIQMGIRTYAVGITPSASQDELLIIANGNDDYVFASDKCDGLETLVNSLSRKICDNN